MLDRFTEKAIKIVMLAESECRRLGHATVGAEHLLLGSIGEGTSLASKCWRSIGINLKDARVEVEKIRARESDGVPEQLPLNESAQAVIEGAWAEARRMTHNYVGPEHLVLSLTNDAALVAQVICSLGTRPELVRDYLQRQLIYERSPAPEPLTPIMPSRTLNEQIAFIRLTADMVERVNRLIPQMVADYSEDIPILGSEQNSYVDLALALAQLEQLLHTQSPTVRKAIKELRELAEGYAKQINGQREEPPKDEQT